MVFRLILTLVITFSSFAFADNGAPANRNRMEELFLWKISEELKLSVSEEKEISEYIKDFNKRRNTVNDDIQASLKKIGETSEVKASAKALANYKNLIKKYNDLSIEEIDRMKKILGPVRASKYFVVKNDLSNRIKTLLASPEKPEDEKSLGTPKIIVE